MVGSCSFVIVHILWDSTPVLLNLNSLTSFKERNFKQPSSGRDPLDPQTVKEIAIKVTMNNGETRSILWTQI